MLVQDLFETDPIEVTREAVDTPMATVLAGAAGAVLVTVLVNLAAGPASWLAIGSGMVVRHAVGAVWVRTHATSITGRFGHSVMSSALAAALVRAVL